MPVRFDLQAIEIRAGTNFMMICKYGVQSVMQHTTMNTLLYFTLMHCTILYCTVQLARSPRLSTGDKSGLSFWILCSLFVCLFSVCKFSHFIQYSTVEYSTVQYKAAGPPSRDCSECDYRICSRVNLKTHYQTNCNGCAKRFCGRRHLKTHNTFREAVRLYNILAHSTQWSTGL